MSWCFWIIVWIVWFFFLNYVPEIIHSLFGLMYMYLFFLRIMTGPTHLAAWLIIGHLTGDYVTALACSYLVDADHLIPIIKQWFLFKPKQMWKWLLEAEDTIITDQRNYFHSIFALILFSVLFLLINIHIWIVFAIAYAGHLLIDMFDASNFYPFYPIKSVNIKWRIRYCSKQEFIFAWVLVMVRVILILTSGRF
jgi:hypothetical protein